MSPSCISLDPLSEFQKFFLFSPHSISGEELVFYLDTYTSDRKHFLSSIESDGHRPLFSIRAHSISDSGIGSFFVTVTIAISARAQEILLELTRRFYQKNIRIFFILMRTTILAWNRSIVADVVKLLLNERQSFAHAFSGKKIRNTNSNVKTDFVISNGI